METLTRSGRTEQISATAHTLKGSAASIGAVRMAELCDRLEAAVRSGEVDRISASLRELSVEFEHVRTALISYRAMEQITA